MASLPKKPEKQKLAELKREIEELLAHESGRIDAGLFKEKYCKHFGKAFKLPRDIAKLKLTPFFESYMSDIVEISKKGTANFIEAKTKRKEAVPVNPEKNVVEKEERNVTKKAAPVTVNVQPFNYVPKQKQPSNSFSFVESQTKVAVEPHIGARRSVKAQVDNIVEELAKENHVNVDDVKKRLFERLKVKNAGELGYRRSDDIPGIRELVRKQREINASIQAFILVRSVSTLPELSSYLTNLYSEAREFEDLHLGPLVKHPLVYDYFKFPPNQEPPDISTLKVMKYLKQFMNKKKLWSSRVELQEFLQYLTEQMSCSSPYELGIRIESVALMISAIKRCSSAENSIRKEAEKKLQEEIADEIEQHVQRNKKRLLGSNQAGLSDPDALVNSLLGLSPVDILTKLFEFCCTAEFFGKKVKKKVEDFIKTCNEDRTCRKLFQLALHKSCWDLVKPVEEVVPLSCHSTRTGDYTVDELGRELSLEPALQPSPIAKDVLLNEVKRWLTGKSSKSMDIKFLARVEERIVHSYKVYRDFQQLGHGSFLEFLSSQPNLLALLSPPGKTAEEIMGKFRKSDAIELIQQCGVETDKTRILKTIYAQFRPDSSLDDTTLDVLIDQARQQANQPDKIIYEAYLASSALEMPEVSKNAGRGLQSDKHVGSMGYLDKNVALQCLCQTPLLEDLAVWSNWDHVFAPMYGSLKAFLKGVNHIPGEVVSAFFPDDLVAMETSTGCLLRVTRRTSMEKFLESAKDGDVIGTAGHLVSLVLYYGGMEKAPLALLANHMKDALLSSTSSSQPSTSVDANEYVVKFTIRCLQRIPNLLRIPLAMQIFIEPLQHVFGHTAAPGLILKQCKTYDEKSMVYALGVRLGITEWQEDFKIRLARVVAEEKTLDEREYLENSDDHRGPLKKSRLVDTDKEPVSEVDQHGVVGDLVPEDRREEKDNFSDEARTLEASDPDLDLSEKERQCRGVIESIRRDEFGIGIELPPEHRQMVENQRLREGRGLHRLSSELYSKDTHFVLELVQNADDNSYPEQIASSVDPPSIAFFVNIDKIVVLNNEVGFEEKNIRALCDVGKSTKGKQRYGYIGQKGIGFKSVFRITDTPEVHSNGYHIRFDAKSGPTGYILPHWCDLSDEDDTVVNLGWTTRIVLTLKDEMKTVQKKTLIARFHDIQPSLLLFLRRLRQIRITEEVSNTTREMFRHDLGDNLIELRHSNGADLWFVVKKELPASNMKPDIETTEIALAFPLPKTNSDAAISLEDVTANIRAKSLIQQPVFAFLPLRSYGFRFIIQADFDVPSSREDVDKDSAWNQWLRQEISNLFVHAFDDFKDHPCFDGVASIVQLLQFIPLEDEILDFFKPVTRTIIDGISRKQCIPVRSEFSSNVSPLDCFDEVERSEINQSDDQMTTEDAGHSERDNLKWVFPSQAVVADERVLEELISGEVLGRYLGKYYLHPDLQSLINPPLCRALGIEVLSCRHLIDIGKAISSEVVAKLKGIQKEGEVYLEEFCCWVAKWLCAVHRCLERERDCSEETLREIASLSLYPLSDGQFTTLSGPAVFLPLGKEVKGEHSSNNASHVAAGIVHKDLRSLHPMVLSSLDDIGKSQVRKLLESLQVRCLTSQDLIKHHIIPSLKSNQKQMTKSPDVLCSYIIYIKEQWDLDPGVCDLEELRSCALVNTNKGFVNPDMAPVHFTVEYGNKIDLEKDFPSVDWTLLDKTYRGFSHSKLSATWEKFFTQLGVIHFLAIERKDVCLSKSELSSSVWSSLSEFWPEATGNGRYTVKDYASSELDKLLSPDSSEEELKKLAEILDQTWNEKYSKYTEDVPYVNERGTVLGQTYSSFFLNLKERSWLPSKYGLSRVKFSRCLPREVFLDDKEVIDLLGDHAWYAVPRLTNKKFLAALGIQTSVKFETLLQVFMEWVTRSQSEDESEFETSIEHMTNVYQFMEDQIKDQEKRKFLEDVIKNKNVLFIPNGISGSTRSNNTNAAVKGEFVAKKHVYWFDPSNLMQELPRMSPTSALNQPRRMLKVYYPDLHNFFVDFVRIDESPNLNEYVGLMEAIAAQSSMASGPLVDQMMRVFNVVGTKCLEKVDNANFVKRKVTKLKVFPTLEDKWVSLEEKPLFSDDKSLEKLFRDRRESAAKKDGETIVEEPKEKLHFLKMGLQRNKKRVKGREEMKLIEIENAEKEKIRENVRSFFEKVCGVRNLSECVSQEIISMDTSGCYDLQLLLHQWIPLTQRFLYCKHLEYYEKHQEDGMAEALESVQCFKTKKLDVVHRISTHPSINVSVKKECAIEKKDAMVAVYVTDRGLHDTNDIIKELAKFFAPPENVADMNNFLLALARVPEDKIEYVMQEEQDLDVLPEHIQIWQVPEPERVEIPISQPLEQDLSLETEDVVSAETGNDRRRSEIDGEPRGLQSWPPKSSAMPPQEITGKNPSTEQVLTMWPPPAPPEEYSPQEMAPRVTADPQQDNRVHPIQPHADQESSVPTSPVVQPQDLQPSISVVEQYQPKTTVATDDLAANVDTTQGYVNTLGTRPPPVSPGDMMPKMPYDRPLPRSLTVSGDEVTLELEEIQLGTLTDRPELITLAKSAKAEEIGRWGEDCVYKLLQKMGEGRQGFQVVWLNKDIESGQPYDIVVTEQDTEITYIEVKSTSSSEKNVLEISSGEIKCAFQQKERFHLYRVYNAGNPSDFRVSRLRNLGANLDSKAVKLFILI